MTERLSKQDLDLLGHGIDSLLKRQLDRIRRRFVTHGLGWVVAALCGIGICYFLLDRTLHLPALVRILFSLAFVGFAVVAIKRRLVYPMSKAFTRADVAVVVERKFPELREKLISAVQFKDVLAENAEDTVRGESRAMVEKVVAEAANDVQKVPLREVLTPRRTARVWSGAVACVAVAGLMTALNPTTASVFLQRSVGLSTAYPRLTTLVVELPTEDPDFRITREGGLANVTLAAGSQLPVLVRVEGVEPREVFLVLTGGRGMAPEVAMTKRPGGRFRHMFRNVRSNFSFHARGGDDPTGDLTVKVETVHPPLVSTIQSELDFPDYTGLPSKTAMGGSVEALIGTRARLVVTATAPVAKATLRFLEADNEMPLRAISIQDDSGVGQAFAGEFLVQSTDRYQIELTSPEGLSNPNPGAYPIIAQRDHEPVGKLLQPPGDDILVVVPGALVPLRVAARDDYGLVRIAMSAKTARDDQETTLALFDRANGAADAPPLREHIVTELIDLTTFAGGSPAVGDSVALTATLTDNKEPEAGTTELSTRHVHVVDAPELARRISGHFRRLREDVEKALDVQSDRRILTLELIEELPDLTDDSTRRSRLVAVEVGQGRIQTSADRIRRDLMRSFDVHLFNRLEESIHAPKVIELYLEYHGENGDAEEAWLPGFYRKVDEERKGGRIGAMERTLDPILDMTIGADRIATQYGPRAVKNLEEAGIAQNDEDRTTLLQATVQIQDQILVELGALQSRLAEWNEFQDVIQQARALRDQQRDVENRTRSLRGGANK